MPKQKHLPMLLLILDGWGIDEPNKGNAIALANTVNIDGFKKKYPYTELWAHGEYVGAPKNQVGNSEAGHMNIGAGRIVKQDAVRISKSVEDGTFFKNPAFLGAIRHVKRMNSKMHVMGMLSNGQSPHSDPGHLAAMLKVFQRHKIGSVYLHLFTDGRDSPKYVSMKLIGELEKQFTGSEFIATIIGRFYSMDRKKKWSRTERAYNTLVKGEGHIAGSPEEAITESYNRGDSDEFIEPYIIERDEKENTRIEDGDSVIFMNLRSDRGRQLSKAFVQAEFESKNPASFKRKKIVKRLYFTAMTDFGPDLDDIITAFPSVDLDETLPMSLAGLRQLYIAETEKYAHVTYFFNGGYSGTVENEKHLMVNSPDVKSYDQTPAMSSAAIAKIILNNLKENKFDFTLCNFAAPDMIGHTGNLKAAVNCCRKIDELAGKLAGAYLARGGTVVLTADHGNIEKMINLETGEVYTEHTTNKVPFVIMNKETRGINLKKKGVLADIAPTVLKLLDIDQPKRMTGKPLF
jgi:2,3-bisphosphoglycerate-independent phosphoglycerate mutase